MSQRERNKIREHFWSFLSLSNKNDGKERRETTEKRKIKVEGKDEKRGRTSLVSAPAQLLSTNPALFRLPLDAQSDLLDCEEAQKCTVPLVLPVLAGKRPTPARLG